MARTAEIFDVTLGAVRRLRGWRPRALPALAMVGSLIVAGLVALAVDLAVWRTRPSVEDGERLIDNGEYAAAVRTLLRVVSARPDDPRAHYYLGLAYARLDVPAGAMNQLSDAVRLAPRSPLFHEGLARALRAAGDQASALREFEEAVRLGPDDPRYQIGLAELLLDQGQGAAAVERLRVAEQLRPRSPEIHLLFAKILERVGDHNGMIREYGQVTRLADGDPLGIMARLELQERSPR